MKQLQLLCAEWIIDLGPEEGEKGGEIVVAGTPEEVAKHPTSHPGRYLSRCWRRIRPRQGQIESGSKGVGKGLGVAWVETCHWMLGFLLGFNGSDDSLCGAYC